MSAPLWRLNRVARSWKQREERSNAALLRLMVWASLRFGRRLGRVLLYPLTWYFVLSDKAGRRASRAYLRRIQTQPPTLYEVFKHFWSFSSTVHDRLYLLHNQWQLFEIRTRNQEIIDAALAEGHGALLMGAHLGSFEVLRAAGRSRTSLRVVIAMYERNARKLNAALASINPDASADIISLGQPESMLQVWEHLDRGAVVGMLADRFLEEDSGQMRPFLGSPAQWPEGPFRMAAVLKQPVFFMTGLYCGGNKYSLHFEPLADFSAVSCADREQAIGAAMTRYVALVEQYCRAAPYNWFNFFDFWLDDAEPARGPDDAP